MKRFNDAEIDQLIERVCNTVGDGHSLREETISDLLDAIKWLRKDRDDCIARTRKLCGFLS